MKIKGFISQIFAVLSGVGQGTHLGPIIFIIFINDSHTQLGIVKSINLLMIQRYIEKY